MTHSEFTQVFMNAYGRRKLLLVEKSKQYTRSNNRFEAFDRAARFDNDSSPLKEAWHLLKKHLVTINNLITDINNNNKTTIEAVLEPLDDARNYLDLIEGMIRRNLGE